MERVRPFFDTTDTPSLQFCYWITGSLPVQMHTFILRYLSKGSLKIIMEKHSMLTATKHSPTRRLTILNNCSCLVMWDVFHLTKSAENLETKANGTEISRESSQKIRKMLNLRNASHSAEDSRKFRGAKLNRNKPSAITCFDIPCWSRAPNPYGFVWRRPRS